MNTDLEVVRVEEVLSHDAGPSRSPCVGDLTPVVLVGSECHRLHVLCVGEPTLLLVAVAAALQTCVCGGGVKWQKFCERVWVGGAKMGRV